MVSVTKLSVGALVAFSLGWAADAGALGRNCCTREWVCNDVSTYHPARYTNGGAGDVALVPTTNAPTGAEVALAPIAAALGFRYVHAELLYDGSGSTFTQTYWDSNSPPSSDSTGEPHVCSRVISPFYLARLSPGAGTSSQDAVPADLVKGFGHAGCTVPSDGYHFNSFIHDDVPGGSCEKVLVDYCGVPVSATEDRKVYGPADSFNALSTVWDEAYATCMKVIDSFWPWDGIGCGGVSEEDACGRAAYQVVNEMLYKQYSMDGWSTYNIGGVPIIGVYPPVGYDTWSGTPLGDAKDNYQFTMGADGLPAYGCQTGWGPPITPCAGYQIPSWTINDPDDIANAAKRLGATVVAGTIAPGYYTTSEVCGYQEVCSPDNCTLL